MFKKIIRKHYKIKMNKKSKLKKATFWPPKLVCVLWCLGMLNFLEKGNWLFAIVQFGLLRLSSKTSEVQTPPPGAAFKFGWSEIV